MTKLITIACLGLMCQASAQSIQNKVSASAGTTYTNTTAMLEFTVGETMTSLLSQGTGSISQGFHQPTLTVTPLLKNDEGVFVTATPEQLKNQEQEVAGTPFSVQVYPNPAVDYLHIVPRGEINETVTVHLYNSKGELLRVENMDKEPFTLNFAGLAQGTYLVAISSSSGSFNNMYRIQKLN